MSKCTKGKVIAEAFPGTDKDPTWIIQIKGGGVIFQTVGANDKVHAETFVRRWNAFEEGGLVELCRDLKARLSVYEGRHRSQCTLGDECPDKKLLKKVEAALAKS